MDSGNTTTVKLIIDEADLAADYFRCASRINAHSSVANHKQYQNLLHPIDKRALFISQQFLLSNTHEDFAKFLHALHEKKESGIPLQRTLSGSDDRLSHYPSILQKFTSSQEFLDWLGIDRKKLIKKARKKTTVSKKQAQNIIEDRIKDMMNGLKICRTQKKQRHRVYNTLKHGKLILCIRPEFLYKIEDATEMDGPHFFYQEKKQDGTIQLRSHSIPFSDQQFDSTTRGIIQISELIRDLVYFFILQNYPDRLMRLQDSFDKLCDFRKELPFLFETNQAKPK